MKGGKVVFLNEVGEEVSKGDPSAVSRFDTNKYEKMPLGGRRGKKTRKTRRRRRGGAYSREHILDFADTLMEVRAARSLDEKKQRLLTALARIETLVGPSSQFGRMTADDISRLNDAEALNNVAAELRGELLASDAYQNSLIPAASGPDHGDAPPLTVTARRGSLGPSPRRPRVNTDPGIDSPPSSPGPSPRRTQVLNPEDDSPRGGRRRKTRTTRRRS